MFRVVAAQFIASLLVAIGAWMIGGTHAAVSSLLGGLACALPNGLFALNLVRFAPSANALGAKARTGAYALVLLAGELVKVALTIGLLILIVWAYKDLVWLALIISVIAVLWMQAAALVWR
jgi:ATP synthase protein I